MAVKKFKQVSDRTFGSHIEHNDHYRIIYKEFRDNDLNVQQQNNKDNSRDKTTTSRAWYSRNDSSGNNNLHTDHYKQGKRQPDVAPWGDERQE